MRLVSSIALVMALALTAGTTVACVPPGCSGSEKVDGLATTTQDTSIRSKPVMEPDPRDPIIGEGETVAVTTRYTCNDGNYYNVTAVVLYGGTEKKRSGYIPQEHLSGVREPSDS